MIRKANKFDLFDCVEMMRCYAQESPIEALKDTTKHDDKHVEAILFSLIAGRGFILIDEELRGFVAAVIIPNIWCPQVKEIKELAWWVHKEHRNKLVGGKLLLAFDKEASQLVKEGRAHIVSASLMGHKINLDRLGFKQIDSTYVKE